MSIVLENSKMRLVIGEDAKAESLVLLSTGEELLAEEKLPMFSVTQLRPFNNEIKLIYMNKRTTYPANRVRQEGDRLIVGFELAPYEAAVKVAISDSYITFTLDEFIASSADYGHQKMDVPPTQEFRLINLPVKKRENFGKWLNVIWDDSVAVNVLATTPEARIDSEERKDFRILTADAVKGVKLRGCTAALIVSNKEDLFECIDTLEADYGMPRGVKSRQGELIDTSIYWTESLNPDNVDEHIALMKKGGFRLALIYYKSIFNSPIGYHRFGDFNFHPEYKNGIDSVKEVIEKIKAAGIKVGFHFLHTHIGIESHYVTPRADRRLNLTRNFTLSKDLSKTDTVIYVDEDPTDTVMHPDCRILKFGTELISYESYMTEPPYRFIGCKRGALNTEIISHGEGDIGGILDISEFGATSIYLNQNTDLQDEIAEKIAEIYNLGFEFAYYDGSEGVNPPYEYHVPNAQYRVYKRFNNAPLFCEGAAKSHFTWHMLSGANAFDIFPTDVFKEMIDKFPVVAAREMKKDFTRVNFGWWNIYPDTRPDVYEYGAMRATAWNCPMTVMCRAGDAKFPLFDATFSAVKTWQDAKADGFFTADVKKYLQDTENEHTLFVNEKGEYELSPIYEVENGIDNLYTFVFERAGYSYASLAYVGDGVDITLSLSDFEYLSEVCGEKLPKGDSKITVSGRKFIRTSLSLDELKASIKSIKL